MCTPCSVHSVLYLSGRTLERRVVSLSPPSGIKWVLIQHQRRMHVMHTHIWTQVPTDISMDFIWFIIMVERREVFV